jgi:murein DD-endopeptidase MepM/ murein hydrolase activator NlpD
MTGSRLLVLLALPALALLNGCSPAGAQSAASAPAASSAVAASTAGAPASAVAAASASGFAYDPPGTLQSGVEGVTDTANNAPGIRFPIEQGPAFANSQVWGHGGMSGPPGDQCDAADYSYPWHDDFCETRAYSTPTCPSGSGHQGQDIRPSTCAAGVHPAVAVEDGKISQIGTYTVYLLGESGRLYLYLHMQMDKLKVHVGDSVTRGQELGYVSNNFGTSSTTIHLHFEIKEPVTIGGESMVTRVSPYVALVDSYQRMLAGTP